MIADWFRPGGSKLLQVALDRLLGAHRRRVGVLAELFPGAALTQQIVVPVELHLQIVQLFAIVGTQCLAAGGAVQQLVLAPDETLDVRVNVAVVHECSVPADG